MSEKPQRLAFFLTAITALMMVGLIAAILLLRQELRREPDAPINEETVDALRTLSVRLDQMDAAHRERMAEIEKTLDMAVLVEPVDIGLPPPPLPDTPPPVTATVTEPVPVVEEKSAPVASEPTVDPVVELKARFETLGERVLHGEPYEKELAAFNEAAGERFVEPRETLHSWAISGIGTDRATLHEQFVYQLTEIEAGVATPHEDDEFADRMNRKLKGFITFSRRTEGDVAIPTDLRAQAVKPGNDDAKMELIGMLQPEQQALFGEWKEKRARLREAEKTLDTIELGL